MDKLTFSIASCRGEPVGNNVLNRDGPDFKREAPSVGEMAALGKAGESIKRVKLTTL